MTFPLFVLLLTLYHPSFLHIVTILCQPNPTGICYTGNVTIHGGEIDLIQRIVAACLVLLLLSGCLAEGTDIIIRESSKGTGVKYLQEELKQLGFFDGEPDGVYGAATGFAVASYANSKGLDVTLGVNAATIVSLCADTGMGTLDVGSTGTAVYAVQTLLYDMGFLEDAPDGKFGQQTKQAVQQYMKFVSESAVTYMQSNEDARAAAILAVPEGDMPIAYDAPIISAETVVTDGRVTPEWFDFMMNGTARIGADIGPNSGREDVRRVQRRLRALSYTADTRVDGMFGANTERVLKYFQRRNNLEETGICDRDTQTLLFSENAVKSDQYVAPYMAYVLTDQCKVHIMEWTGAGYTREAKVFTCSTGAKNTPTAHGTFQAVGQISPWYYMPTSHVWVRYAFQIQGNYFFHSVLFKSKGATNPTSSSVRNLGSNVSHGCIRLAVEDVQWIYENCTPGMTVVIQ